MVSTYTSKKKTNSSHWRCSRFNKLTLINYFCNFKTEKDVEETSVKSESNPGTPEVEVEQEEGNDDQDVDEIKTETKKTSKKKRLIAPIRIKLAKMPVTQKLQKTLVRLRRRFCCL